MIHSQFNSHFIFLHSERVEWTENYMRFCCVFLRRCHRLVPITVLLRFVRFVLYFFQIVFVCLMTYFQRSTNFSLDTRNWKSLLRFFHIGKKMKVSLHKIYSHFILIKTFFLQALRNVWIVVFCRNFSDSWILSFWILNQNDGRVRTVRMRGKNGKILFLVHEHKKNLKFQGENFYLQTHHLDSCQRRCTSSIDSIDTGCDWPSGSCTADSLYMVDIGFSAGWSDGRSPVKSSREKVHEIFGWQNMEFTNFLSFPKSWRRNCYWTMTSWSVEKDKEEEMWKKNFHYLFQLTQHIRIDCWRNFTTVFEEIIFFPLLQLAKSQSSSEYTCVRNSLYKYRKKNLKENVTKYLKSEWTESRPKLFFFQD